MNRGLIMKNIRFLILCAFASWGAYAQGAPDFTPPTPLFGAILRNDAAQVKRLLAEGANPNEGRFLGFAPIFFPVIAQNPEMVRILVEKGADVQLRDHTGSTTLMWA